MTEETKNTEETNGETPIVHESPVVEEATDTEGVEGGVTSDGAFVPGDAQTSEEIADNKPNADVPPAPGNSETTDEEEAAA